MTFYKNLALIIDTELKANKISAVKAESITANIIENTVKESGGKTLYLKSMASQKLTDKHSQIRADFAAGMSHDSLMSKYLIGDAWLRKILKRGGSNG